MYSLLMLPLVIANTLLVVWLAERLWLESEELVKDFLVSDTKS